jgi:hypothetical protein
MMNVDPRVPLSILRRIEELENESRRLKRASGAALLVLGSLVLMGQARGTRHPPAAKVIEAERVVIRDDQGQIRIAMGINEGGSAGITLSSPAHLGLAVNPDGSAGIKLLLRLPDSRTVLHEQK